MDVDIPLGRKTGYPAHYSPALLCAVPRAGSRRALGVAETLPFDGEDVWTAYDLTWLGRGEKPAVATAILRVPASSPNLIESKSLKLYLGSLSMTRYRDVGDVASVIARDLSSVAGAAVAATLQSLPDKAGLIPVLPGTCIDDIEVECRSWQVDTSLLHCDDRDIAEEALHSHLLRSLCPVTGQPDIGSILIRYRGPRIDQAGLLRYLVSYRDHGDFHEACVERIFVDLQRYCRSTELSVYARYNRRGGLDINPFRSNVTSSAPNLRLWRQ
ncbi:MAG TPA: NADPH-dependent 7-cyano-7-deazaguanine reductase QueF [Woeseiaceae bacterium]|nr:NADPH-dependent 7-cyano-7-deazaguanine reductase QueF [Woeseiaceae bacterium]